MKVAVLGAGRMGRSVVRHLQACRDVSDIVVFDIDGRAAQEAADRHKVRVSASLEDIWSDDGVRLVFVTTSNDCHKELSIRAMQCGKAVLCEKPMATNLNDAVEMVEEAEKLNAYLQIGFELRYSKLYTRVADWISRGTLGEVRNIHCSYICSEFWGKHSWRTRISSGGSMFGEKLSHYFDLSRWWIKSPVEEVYAVASPNIVSYYEVHDNCHATCRYANGAVSHLTFMMPFASTGKGDPLQDLLDQQKDDGHELRFLVMGTKGSVETDVFRRRLKRWEYSEGTMGFESVRVENQSWMPDEDHSYFHNTQDQAHDVVARVRAGLAPGISPRDALETMRVCFAADLSVEQQRSVRLAEIPGIAPAF